jgi:hypothetical protein
LSELNAWDFQLVPKEQEHDWVTLSLMPNFAILGKKLGKKIVAVKKAVTELSHAVCVVYTRTTIELIEPKIRLHWFRFLTLFCLSYCLLCRMLSKH